MVSQTARYGRLHITDWCAQTCTKKQLPWFMLGLNEASQEVLGHCAKNRVVATYTGSMLIVVSLGVAHLVEFRR